MMRVEPHNEDPSANIVTRSGVDKSEGKQSIADVWVQKAPEKKEGYNLKREKDTFSEAKKNFMDLGVLT